ncbi:hypothetical protein QUF72_20290 [Desulfobacterales bacterium HSG2]|nr:hypothetical protein [Desulfobacterales bacterium HSG2]
MKKQGKKSNAQLIIGTLLSGKTLKSRDVSDIIRKGDGKKINVQDVASMLSKVSNPRKSDLGYFIERVKDGNTFAYYMVKEAIKLSEEQAYGLTLKIGKDKYSLDRALKDFPGLRKYVKPGPKSKPAPSKVAKPAPSRPSPSKAAKPAPSKAAKPAPSKAAKPAPSKAAKPAPSKAAKPAPSKAAAKPAPSKAAKPAPSKAAKPAPSKAAKPAPSKVAKPAPSKAAKPVPSKVIRPEAAKPKPVIKVVKKPLQKPAATTTPKSVSAVLDIDKLAAVIVKKIASDLGKLKVEVNFKDTRPR